MPNPAVLTARPGRFANTFRSLRHRNYRYWFIGQTISLSGSWMQTMAQQVLIYRLTGSAAALGLISFIGLIPLIPFSLWGGSLTDRMNKRDLIIATQVIMLVQAVLLGVLAWTGKVQVWQVYVLSLMLAAVNAVDLPARQAFTVDMVEGKEDLTNAIGLNSAMFNLARALGPALAGLVVAAIGEGPAFIINALTFLPVILSLLLMRNLPASSRPAAGRGRASLDHVVGGLRYVRGQPVLMLLISLVAVSAFLSMPYNTLMPVFADVVLAPSAQPVVHFICDGPTRIFSCQAPEALPLGMLLTAVGIGAVIGALVVASMSENAHRGRWLTFGNLGFPIVLLATALNRSFLAALILMAAVGVMFVWQNALANTLIQVTAPDEVRGRVMGLYTMVFQAFMRVGALQAGLMSDWLSAPVSLGLGAVLSLAYGLWIALFKPAVRRL
ncbi:MAG TPA: MFS transporter [Anaerolinea sp.]|nr:MFS transporter [Anaerolinea sp.]